MDDGLSTFLAEANEAQRAAIAHGDGPLLIVAGAGTGKTAVITKRVAHLVASGAAKTDEILALTFTEKAAEEMESRIDKLMPYGYVDLWVMTFHAFGERLLREHGLSIGLPDSFKLLSETDQWMLVRNNLERFGLDYYRPLGNPTRFIHALVRHFGRAKDEMVSALEYGAHAQSAALDAGSVPGEEAGRLKEVADAYEVYTRLLREHDALDFGDLINETVRLLRTRPALLEKYRSQFKYLIVDEFQDTNIAQFELLRLLAGERANITVVGDDDQSVYKFRGASVSNILQFKSYYPHAKEVVLTENYRSPQAILDAAYSFIQHNNPNRLESKLPGLSKRLTANVAHEGKIERIHADSVQTEARTVAQRIAALASVEPKTDLSEIAVLVRANDSAAPFIAEFEAAGIPYLFVASRGLYRKPIVLDIINYLKLLDDYHESPALYRMLAGPVVMLPTDDLLRLTHQAHKRAWSLHEACRNAAALGVSADGLSRLSRFLGLLDRHTALARSADVRRVVFAFLEDTGYLKRLVGEDNRLTRDTLSYMNQFWRSIEEFVSAEAEPTARGFLERIRLELEAGERGALAFDPDIGPEAVRVMTVHGAKGLEFDHVFIVSLIERRFPSMERAEPIELPEALIKEIVPEGDHHLEEERRLFYVGMTRAKRSLYLTWADDYGGARRRKPSRFLAELGFVDAPRITAPQTTSRVIPPTETGMPAAFPVPDTFSFTQLKAFETCPLQYKFAHLLRIPVKGRGSFSFGKTVHATLQKFFTLISERRTAAQGDLFRGGSAAAATAARPVGELVTEEEILKLYEGSWVDDWFETKGRKEEYRAKGKRLLTEYYAAIRTETIHPLYLEKPFNLKIGDATLRGAIDRVDRLPDGTVRIIDYKTGAPKSEKSVERDQLLIYQIASERVLGEKPGVLTYVFLEDGSKVEFIGSAEQLGALESKVMETIGTIRASDFAPTPSKVACDHCDFRDICEFRAS